MLIFVLLATLFTAADLQKDCTSSVPFERAFCLGYLTGFGHAATLATDLTKATTAIRVTSLMDGCPSDEVSTEQARLVFLKYVDNHPEKLHVPAQLILSVALSAAFPCGIDKGESRDANQGGPR